MFQIDLTSRKPIYEQVMDRFKQLIIKEVLKADEKIPSVRELAKELTINPNTIQKSYRELERQGYLYSVKGRGNFVCGKIRKVDEEKLNKLKKQIQNSLSELIYMGMEKEELIELIEATYVSIKGGNDND
ncbi:MAG: GntR family transcriptional regulator [Marinisporobacter sp.]|jgi:GntR family transcriptional regulator|nr:GntR family transcriptional regulator [Marinisporobacter sp.]